MISTEFGAHLPAPIGRISIHNYHDMMEKPAPEAHQHLQFSYVLSGRFDFIFGQCLITVTPGELTVIAPGTFHQWGNGHDQETRLINIHCSSSDPTRLGALTAFFSPKIRERHWQVTVARETVFPLVEQLHVSKKLHANCQQAWEYAISLQILVLFCDQVLKQHQPLTQTTAVPENLLTVLSYIDEHLTHPLTLAELAEVAYQSPSHFSAQFRRYIGLAPISYIQACRIAKAEVLLTQSSWTLAAVASECGFQSQFYFSRLFKQINGIAPSDYRQRHSNNAK